MWSKVLYYGYSWSLRSPLAGSSKVMKTRKLFHNRSLFALILSLALVACGDNGLTAPTDELSMQAGIYLPPFSSRVLEMEMGMGGYHFDRVTFEAPNGVLPLLDVTSSNPSVVSAEVLLQDRGCDRLGCVWTGDILVYPSQRARIGDRATITLRLRANPRTVRSFEALVIAPIPVSY